MSYRKSLPVLFLLLLSSMLYLVMTGNNSPAADNGSEPGINGVVLDNTGQPLENVRVIIKGTDDQVLTDPSGRFFIPFNNPKQRFFQWDILAGKEGYLSGGARYNGPKSTDIKIVLQAIPDFNAPDYANNRDVASGINGFVRSSTGMPLEDARVRIRGSKDFVTTDSQGRYTLPLSNPNQKLFQWIITAGREGYLNGAARYIPGRMVVPIELEAVPDFDSPDYQMVITSPAGPFPNDRGVKLQKDCSNCHTTHYWEWGTSKMGKTTQNDNVLKTYDQFVKAKKAGQPNTCADCHAPVAALQAPGRTDYGQAVNGNFNLSKGIECDFCHKIKDVEVNNSPGVQAIKMSRLNAGGWFFEYGPYDDVVAMPMAASYNPIYTRSQFCSACHQDAVRPPAGSSWDYEKVYPGAAQYPLYEKGTVIPNQWTYQEWLEWQDGLPVDDQDKGRQCQDCHMNWTKEMLPYYRYIVSGDVKNFASERSPETIFPHKFEGASPARLQGSARLFVDPRIDNDVLTVSVGVRNVNAGHRLPTGEHTRNMILLVKAEDENGKPLQFISGPVVPDWGGVGNEAGDYAGSPGKGFARVTADDQGRLNVPIWQATRIDSDNRIKAKETDQSLYRFRLPPGSGEDTPASVTATLIYRKDFRGREHGYAGTGDDIIMQETTTETGDGGL